VFSWQIELPEVDDLLEKLNKVAPKTRKELLSILAPGAVDFRELWTKEDLGFKFFSAGDMEQREYGHCHVGCKIFRQSQRLNYSMPLIDHHFGI